MWHAQGLVFRTYRHVLGDQKSVLDSLTMIHHCCATRCHILKQKCTKFNFGWGSAPDPAVGAHSAPPNPLPGYKGVLLLTKGREGRRGMGNGRGIRALPEPLAGFKGSYFYGTGGKEGREAGAPGGMWLDPSNSRLVMQVVNSSLNFSGTSSAKKPIIALLFSLLTRISTAESKLATLNVGLGLKYLHVKNKTSR